MEDSLLMDTCNPIPVSFDTISAETEIVVSVVDTKEEDHIADKEVRILGMSQGIASIIIPMSVSIIVFSLGIIIDKKREKNKEERERKKYKAAILKWIELLKAPIYTQVEQLKDLASKIDNSIELQPEAFSFSKSMANKINDLSVEKIINTFVAKEKKENSGDSIHAYNIVSQIDFLSLCDGEVIKKYNEYHSRCIALVDKWNLSWNKFDVLRKTSNSSDSQDYSVFRNVLIQYKKWRDRHEQNEHLNYNDISTELIVPLFQALSNMKEEYPSSSLAVQFYDVIHSLYLILNEWNIVKSGYRDAFNEMANQIEKSYSVLAEAKEHFNIKPEL